MFLHSGAAPAALFIFVSSQLLHLPSLAKKETKEVKTSFYPDF